MPYEVQLSRAPAGYVMDAAPPGALTKIVIREFVSSDDGETFVSRLEGFPQMLLAALPPEAKVTPSTVHHLLAVIGKDLKAKVYLNELPAVAKVRAARPIESGEEIREDDIVDIAEFSFSGVDVPDDAAVLCIFSVGWRRGLFFDFSPLGPGDKKRDYSLAKLLGSYYAYLANQAVFNLSEAQWLHLIKSGWFPFASLPKAIVRLLVARAKKLAPADDLLPQVHEAVNALLPRMLERWGRAAAFQPHLSLLRHAADRFGQGDYVSPVAILYPRIEGILRSIHGGMGLTEKPTQGKLAQRAIEGRQEEWHAHSWLLPEAFRRYLSDWYFADFDPATPAQCSRHSVSHGVAHEAEFNEKNACIAFLLIDQLCYLAP